MAAVQAETRFRRIAEKWHALAQRRLAYVRELERSGRWKLFYTDEQYAACLRDAERTALVWGNLTNQQLRLNSGLTPAMPVPSLPV
jgi:hypothetical protein